MTLLLEARELHTYYGASHVLHGVSFSISEGEMVGLITAVAAIQGGDTPGGVAIPINAGMKLNGCAIRERRIIDRNGNVLTSLRCFSPQRTHFSRTICKERGGNSSQRSTWRYFSSSTTKVS